MRKSTCFLLVGLSLAFMLPKPASVLGDPASLPEGPTSACASWQATYFDDTRGYQAPPVVERQDLQIDFDWGHNAPAPGMVSDHFAVRWQCSAYFPAGTYRFTATSDDGMRLYVDGQPLIDGGSLASAFVSVFRADSTDLLPAGSRDRSSAACL